MMNAADTGSNIAENSILIELCAGMHRNARNPELGIFCSRKLLAPKAPGLLSSPAGSMTGPSHVDDVQQEDFELASTVFRRDGLSTPAPMQSRELELSQA